MRFVHSRLLYVDANGCPTGVGSQRIEFESQIQFCHSRGVKHLSQFAADFMFRTCALRRIGGFISFPCAWFSDDATWMVLAKNGVACSQRALFLARASGTNISARKDLVRQKVEAGECFRKFFRTLYGELVVTGPEDDILLRNLMSGVERRINQFAEWEMLNVHGVLHWWRLMKILPLSCSERFGLIQRRYPAFKVLGRFVRCFRFNVKYKSSGIIGGN